MARKRTRTEPRQQPIVPGSLPRPRSTPPTVPNRLAQPDARWQRFQRYGWDKKRG